MAPMPRTTRARRPVRPYRPGRPAGPPRLAADTPPPRLANGLELAVDRIAGVDGVEYMRRYHLDNDRTRLHQILKSDPQPDPHDHPWNFTSTLLAGSYDEWTPDGWHTWHTGDTINRDAAMPHRLELDAPVYTLVTVGPARRRWGFHTATGWVHWSNYPHAGRYLNADT